MCLKYSQSTFLLFRLTTLPNRPVNGVGGLGRECVRVWPCVLPLTVNLVLLTAEREVRPVGFVLRGLHEPSQSSPIGLVNNYSFSSTSFKVSKQRQD